MSDADLPSPAPQEERESEEDFARLLAEEDPGRWHDFKEAEEAEEAGTEEEDSGWDQSALMEAWGEAPVRERSTGLEWDFGVIRDVPEGFRCGYVVLAGRPNVGKSTLLNVLMGDKIAIVSEKPQTTRRRVVGVLTSDVMQAVFLDTPGIHQPRVKAGEAMVRHAEEAIREADVILCLVDASVPPTPEDRLLVETVRELAPETPHILVPNKIDLLHHQELEERLVPYTALGNFTAVVPVSALYATQVDRLLETASSYLPTAPPLYPGDVLSPEQERDTAAEMIREAVLHHLYEEVPHSVAVEVEEWKERPNGMTYIRATIYVEKASQKKILIGAGGRTLRQIGVLARQQLQEMLTHKVYLDLWVKVWKNWRKDERALRRLGLWNP